MTASMLSDLLNRLLSGPFCCIIIVVPGLLYPLYRWLKSLLKKEA